jgi:hypothetical protein
MIKESKIEVGQVVAFKDTKGDCEKNGYYKVTSIRGGKVNLGSIFGRSIYYKGIPVDEVYECQDKWNCYCRSQTESYMCM